MQIKGILFDKDGTILKFQELWLPVTKIVIRDFIIINKLPMTKEMEKMLEEALGVEHDTVAFDGPLAYMTYEQIGEVVAKRLKEKKIGDGIDSGLAGRQFSVLYETVLSTENNFYIPTCDLKRLFAQLKKRKIVIGLATADNFPVTMHCLKQLGVEKEFDFIGCDDGVLRPKPHPDLFEAFCRKFGLEAKEVAVVGDTANDMQFAKQCGAVAVGTLSGVAGREVLIKQADYIVDTPAKIPSLIGENR